METKTLKDYLRNRKAQQIGARVTTVLTIIITIVVLFNLFASLVPEVQSAGDTLGDSNTCSVAGGIFNSSQGLCLNGTNPEDTAVVGFNSIPVNSLFSSTGVVVLLLMVFLLLSVLRLVMPSRR